MRNDLRRIAENDENENIVSKQTNNGTINAIN